MYSLAPTINQSGQKLQIFISARNLKDLDIFSKSDPYAKISFRRNPKEQFLTLGRTETVDNNLNPNFKQSFIVDYIFEARQDIRFDIWDEDDKKNSTNDDFIGSAETTLGMLAGAKDQTSILTLNAKGTNQSVGKVIIRVEPVTECNVSLRMKWRAVKLTNTDSFFDWWDKSDPYLKLLKIRNDNSYVEACRTDIVKNNLEPNWKPIEIPVSKLIRENSPDGKFKIECWDWEEEGQSKHQFIGEVFLTMLDLKGIKQFPYELILKNPKIAKPGVLVLQSCQQIIKPSFLDYLRGGLQLSMSVAIDFTGSNGIPSQPSSLHYMNPHNPNQYQQAIMAIGNILLHYDYDKRIPSFGFGAKTRFNGVSSMGVSHVFPLSGNNQDIEAFGLESLMLLYKNALQNVELSGPTYFGPLIQQFMSIAKASEQEGSNVYQVLLILTDGQIHDMQPTIDLLVANSLLPLSLIIVGVGDADFTNMNTLDGDNGLYNSQGKKAARDIVQFVPFRDVKMNPDLLAQELLAELPGQVTQYMSLIGKVPGVANQNNINEIMHQSSFQMQQNIKNNLPELFAGLTLGNPEDKH